jgi:serine/threonine protein kinase/Tol biopolymer transport system component
VAKTCPKCQTENPDDSKFCKECATPLTPSDVLEVSVTKTLETPPDLLARGTLFAGRYEIIEALGAGGMGRVYRVEDKKVGQEIALKLIRPEVASNKRSLERFRHELKTARMISHRNVCRMFDLGEDMGTYFITMEYVPGEDLRSFLRRSKHLSMSTVVDIAEQISEGLAEAHRLGIVHRDLKPSNIMIDRDGNARIMDFGIARLLSVKGITAAGVAVGTPDYMSPEQVEGKEADGRSDIYSLGIILYEMVTGRVPFEADTPYALGYKHKNERPVSPKALNPQIPDHLNALVLKCLEKAPEQRPQTADELRTELGKIERGLPTRTWTTPILKRKTLTSKEITIKFTAKKLILPGLAAVALLAAVILAAIFLIHRARQPMASPVHKQVTFTGKASNPAISPDGKFLAYVDGLMIEEQKVMVQDMVSGQAIEVFRGRRVAGLRWTPDGAELSFWALENGPDWAAFIVPRLGGKPRRMAGIESDLLWSSNGAQFVHFSRKKSQIIFTDKRTGDSRSIPLEESIAENLEDWDWSPSGKFIVLTTSNSEGKYSMWVIAADGSGKSKIIDDTEFWVGSPHWSPRGDAIYYLQQGEMSTEIWKLSVSPGTGKPSKPPVFLLEAMQGGSSFSLTDDARQLFIERGSSSSNLWLAALEGPEDARKVDLKQLTTGTKTHHGLSFSPDGELIAYATGSGSTTNVYVMPAGGGPSQQITFMSLFTNGPVWSPDGKEVAFFAGQRGSYKIWKVGAAGGQPYPFAKTEGGVWPVWAPGQKILYRLAKDNSLWLLDPATEDVKPLQEDSAINIILWPKCSPDGKKIAALCYGDPNTEPAIWLISLEGSSPLIIRIGRAFPLGWSADGKWVYALVPGGNFDVVAISVETGQSKPWLSLPPSPEMGRVVPLYCSTDHGERFIFSARKEQPDIWTIENFDPEVR